MYVYHNLSLVSDYDENETENFGNATSLTREYFCFLL
jgi:hypothetical protein